MINETHYVAQNGIGIGSAIAIVCSWQRNRSILWAIAKATLAAGGASFAAQRVAEQGGL